MKIFAIDPGTKYTGIAYGEGNITKELVTDVIEPDKRFFAEDRLYHMALLIVKRIHGYKPDAVVFEDYGFGGSFFNVEVAELIGVTKFLMTQTGLNFEVMFIAPNTVKLQIAGNGRATKSQMKKAAKQLCSNLGLKMSHDADAVAIYEVARRYYAKELDAKTMRALKGRRFVNERCFTIYK